MTRDERILRALADGAVSTAAVAAAAGLPERTVRAGLAHLRKEGLIVTPERGRYRLIGPGRTMIDDSRASGPLRPVPAGDPGSMVAGRSPDQPAGDDDGPEPTGAGPGLVIVGLALLAALVRWMIVNRQQGEPPPLPPADPWAPSW